MRVGDRIAERFAIEAEAGAGGMGTVYCARDHFSGEPVAVKVLQAEIHETFPRLWAGRGVTELQHRPLSRPRRGARG